jgi:hypothetical protein
VPDEEPQEQPPPTVLDRLIAAGVSEDRAREWITSGGARVDGEVVTAVDSPAPPPLRVVLYPA